MSKVASHARSCIVKGSTNGEVAENSADRWMLSRRRVIIRNSGEQGNEAEAETGQNSSQPGMRAQQGKAIERQASKQKWYECQVEAQTLAILRRTITTAFLVIAT